MIVAPAHYAAGERSTDLDERAVRLIDTEVLAERCAEWIVTTIVERARPLRGAPRPRG